MALTGRLDADFQPFYAACAKAEVALRDIESGAGKVTTSLNKMVDQFSGRKLITDAVLMAEAVERIGGVSQLTATELAAVGAKASEAAAKMKAMGLEVPPGIQKIADASKAAGAAQDGWGSALSKVNSLLGVFGVAVSVAGLARFVGGVFDAASNIHDMSLKLGISSEAVQGFKFAAEQAGSSLDSVSTAINKMNVNLATGEKSTIAALKSAGLEFDKIRSLKSEDAFLAITDAIQKIPDPMLRAQVTMALFGKTGAELLPAIVEGFRAAADGASKMSNQTVSELEKAQDAWSELGHIVTIATGSMIAKMLEFKNTLLAQNFGLLGGLAATKSLKEETEKLPPVIQRTATELAEEAAALKRAAEEMERLTKAQRDHINSIADKLFGSEDIKRARDYVEAIGRIENVSALSGKAQAELAMVMRDAVEAMVLSGHAADDLTGQFETYRLKATETARDGEAAFAAITAAAQRAAEEAKRFATDEEGVKRAMVENFAIIGQSAEDSADQGVQSYDRMTAAVTRTSAALQLLVPQGFSFENAYKEAGLPIYDIQGALGPRRTPSPFAGNSVTVPGLAAGGIVTSPTVAMIGEKGPEAIVPLGKFGGGGLTIINHIDARESTYDTPAGVQRMADKVTGAIVARLTTAGVRF